MKAYSNRISIDEVFRRGEYEGTHTSMFIQDFSSHLMLNKWQNNSGKVWLESEFTNMEAVVSQLIRFFSNFERESFSERVISYINMVGYVVGSRGYFILEKVDLNDGRIFLVEVGGEVKFGTRFLKQAVTPKDEEIETYISIPREKCFILEMPRALGGRKRYIEFLKKLDKLDKEAPLRQFDFFNSSKLGYNVIEHHNWHKLEMWKRTKFYGWDHRGDHDLFSGYYRIYRQLLLQKSKILLRDSIIDYLKEVVREMCDLIEKPCELKVSGLQTLEDIEDVIARWKKGDLTVQEVVDAISSRPPTV